MKSCLVIDDSSIVRKVERRIMENLSFTAAEAELGQDAITYCQSNGMPDAILVDCTLPDMPSHEVVTLLRSMPGGGNTYIIYCASENEPKEITRAMSSGANDYILKPFTREELTARLSSAGLV
jgi:two-component system chemotaxis response regulator CheY